MVSPWLSKSWDNRRMPLCYSQHQPTMAPGSIAATESPVFFWLFLLIMWSPFFHLCSSYGSKAKHPWSGSTWKRLEAPSRALCISGPSGSLNLTKEAPYRSISDWDKPVTEKIREKILIFQWSKSGCLSKSLQPSSTILLIHIDPYWSTVRPKIN